MPVRVVGKEVRNGVLNDRTTVLVFLENRTVQSRYGLSDFGHASVDCTKLERFVRSDVGTGAGICTSRVEVQSGVDAR